MCKKSLCLEYFWSVFFEIWTEYGPEELLIQYVYGKIRARKARNADTFYAAIAIYSLNTSKKIIASLGNFKGTCSEFESWFVFFLLGLFDSLNGLLLVLRWLNHIYLIFQVRLKCWWLSSCICQYHGKNK